MTYQNFTFGNGSRLWEMAWSSGTAPPTPAPAPTPPTPPGNCTTIAVRGAAYGDFYLLPDLSNGRPQYRQREQRAGASLTTLHWVTDVFGGAWCINGLYEGSVNGSASYCQYFVSSDVATPDQITETWNCYDFDAKKWGPCSPPVYSTCNPASKQEQRSASAPRASAAVQQAGSTFLVYREWQDPVVLWATEAEFYLDSSDPSNYPKLPQSDFYTWDLKATLASGAQIPLKWESYGNAGAGDIQVQCAWSSGARSGTKMTFPTAGKRVGSSPVDGDGETALHPPAGRLAQQRLL